MTLNEAKEYLNENGYELLDEGFLGDKYKKIQKSSSLYLKRIRNKL